MQFFGRKTLKEEEPDIRDEESGVDEESNLLINNNNGDAKVAKLSREEAIKNKKAKEQVVPDQLDVRMLAIFKLYANVDRDEAWRLQDPGAYS